MVGELLYVFVCVEQRQVELFSVGEWPPEAEEHSSGSQFGGQINTVRPQHHLRCSLLRIAASANPAFAHPPNSPTSPQIP